MAYACQLLIRKMHRRIRSGTFFGAMRLVLGLADQTPTLIPSLDLSRLEELWTDGHSSLWAGALGMSAAVTNPAAAAEPDPAALLEQRISAALFNPSGHAASLSLGELRLRLSSAQAAFNQCRYLWLADAFPELIASSDTTLAAAPSAEAAALASASYQLASNAVGKLAPAAGLQPVAADRAVRRAQQSGNPLVLAQARRTSSTAARRVGDCDQAERVGVHAIEELPLTDSTSAELWSHASHLWCVTGYAAAVRGDRDRSADCYAEASAVAARIDDRRQRQQAGDYALAHQISSAFKLGDSAIALDCARQIRVEALPTTERKGRYMVDLAMSWHQHGRDDQAYRTLVLAEQHAPGEVRTRASARGLIRSLAVSPRRAAMPDLLGLASRAHVAL